ncbi:hypothetical protein KVT40_007432 [Elsinoe batatas]|uniref:Zn(2)-C6 fungal-type domain-containing protein n=1 Tax=Elsinoe batatas TaxID=2601811 RepID=A0A8K0KW39_9PEZI|nr:hypothetical protein KVT40_007432 [Elsinoe batatas]
MFDSFDAQTGQRIAPPTKQVRSDRGCSACRKKKKRCDLQKPKCFRCRNSTSRSVCEWPYDDPAPTSPLDTTLPGVIAFDTLSYQNQKSPGCVNTPAHNAEVIPHPSLNALCHDPVVIHALRLTPSLSHENVASMIQAFEDACLDPEKSGQSISVMSMQLALQHPPLLHAWLACAGLPYAYRDPQLRPLFLTHYTAAVKGLADTLPRDGFHPEEWMQATILTLHIFEEHQATDHVSITRQSHIRGAHLIFRDSLSLTEQASRHQTLLLEAYICRTSVNCLCDGNVGLPYDHLEAPLKVLLWSARQHDSRLTTACPWAGPSGPKLTDLCFKLSWLLQQYPLSGEDLVRHDLLKKHLSELDSLVLEDWDIDSQLSHSTLQIRWIYYLACDLLSAVLSNVPTIDMISTCDRGIRILEDLNDNSNPTLQMMWPLAILGTGCSKEARLKCSAVLEDIRFKFSPGTAGRVKSFHNKVWSRDSSTRNGPYLLLDKDMIGDLFF